MSLPEGELGDRYVHLFAGGLYASINVAMIDFGIQLFMCLYGLSVFLDTPKALRKGRLPYIAISAAILILSALATALDAYTDFTAMFFSMGPRAYYEAAFAMEGQWPRFLSVTCLEVYVLLGDGLLLYRCYIIWKDFLWPVLLPGLIYLAVLGVELTRIVQRCRYPGEGFTEAYLDLDRLTAALFVLLTIASNIILTGLIVYRLLRAHSQLSKALPGRNTKVYRSIAGILIESALPLAVFGLGFAVCEILRLTRSGSVIPRVAGSLVFNVLYWTFTALSPQMIIFRVTTGKSWMSHDEITRGDGVSQPLRFNSGPETDSYLTSTGVRTRRTYMDEENQNFGHNSPHTSEKGNDATYTTVR
ncbi:hypothetical protein CC1G_10480 [Coprinopsis cinerea okayama7|uniref:G-protein coupled receptors family 1 profile domain-containing protein n=1 Tax=Coprinopsis cinerea (strain Okayama-7 / 130 / ATCC MYA-4618 / FGSC 9003) TaxID=240176 RepID=A8NL41_COPC7|nr:hypothetical protein CC1G_10480 [Coprinopsis cinerea okayama7\|eukprot:XP_001834606.1 hypothetical protein CC1G_10480 [Coprinopsis cinerea okayama7\